MLRRSAVAATTTAVPGAFLFGKHHCSARPASGGNRGTRLLWTSDIRYRRCHLKSRNTSSSSVGLAATTALLWLAVGSSTSRFYSSQKAARYPFGFSFSSAMTTLRDGSGTITVVPKNEADQSATVIICHGLGDTAEGFADVAENLAKQMPYVKFILPTAPTQPVTMNGGMSMPAWYDIVGLDDRANEHCAGIEESQARISGLLEKEHADTGLPYSRMLLAGFSQGGALSLYTGLQFAEKLAGIVVLSGYLAGAKSVKLQNEAVKELPILHCHGTADPLVVYQNAVKSQSHVTETLGVSTYELKTYEGLPHSVSPQELADVLAFLKKVLPADDTCRVTLKDPATMSVKELKEAIRRAGLSRQAVGFTEKREFINLLQNHRDGKL